MLGSYVSLDPTYANERSQVRTDRERVYRHRLKEASGGEGANFMGLTTGATSGYWTYLLMRNRGMSLLPLQTKNLTTYAMVFGASVLGFLCGHGLVAGQTGDP